MARRVAALILIAGFALLAVAFLGGCASLPVSGQVCYTAGDGQRVCAGVTQGGITLSGELRETGGFAK